MSAQENTLIQGAFMENMTNEIACEDNLYQSVLEVFKWEKSAKTKVEHPDTDMVLVVMCCKFCC